MPRAALPAGFGARGERGCRGGKRYRAPDDAGRAGGAAVAAGRLDQITPDASTAVITSCAPSQIIITATQAMSARPR